MRELYRARFEVVFRRVECFDGFSHRAVCVAVFLLGECCQCAVECGAMVDDIVGMFGDAMVCGVAHLGVRMPELGTTNPPKTQIIRAQIILFNLQPIVQLIPHEIVHKTAIEALLPESDKMPTNPTTFAYTKKLATLDRVDDNMVTLVLHTPIAPTKTYAIFETMLGSKNTH
jgi:hypothetical protein